MKFCKDCKYYVHPPGIESFDCRHPNNIDVSPVDGSESGRLYAISLRKDESKCGMVAKWFEARNAVE